MDRAFQLALEPKQHFCLGAALSPLTLGHIFLLRRADSAILEEQYLNRFELAKAVFICAQQWQKAQSNLLKWYSPLILNLWGRKVGRADINKEFEKFSAYLSESLRIVQIKRDLTKNYADPTAPWEWRLLVALMTDFHLSEDIALNLTVIKANCLWVTRAELRGEAKLWTDRDEDFWKFAQEQDRLRGLN